VENEAIVGVYVARRRARGNVDGIVMGSREIKKRLWVIRLGLWEFCTIEYKDMLYWDMDWIELAMDRLEHVLL